MDNREGIIKQIEVIDQTMATLKKKRAVLENELLEVIKEDVTEQLKDKDYGTGTANVLVGDYQVKTVISKKVKWSQPILANIFDRIKADGENPLEYIKVEYDVSETAYKSWPSMIQKIFEPARIVEPSKPKVTFERKDD